VSCHHHDFAGREGIGMAIRQAWQPPPATRAVEGRRVSGQYGE